MPDLPSPSIVEIERRSVVMLAPGQPALDREQALRLYERLIEALTEVDRLRQR